MRAWWNWQTHQVEGLTVKSLTVKSLTVKSLTVKSLTVKSHGSSSLPVRTKF